MKASSASTWLSLAKEIAVHGAAVPETLVDAIRYFSNPDTCLSFLVSIRWPDGLMENLEH